MTEYRQPGRIPEVQSGKRNRVSYLPPEAQMFRKAYGLLEGLQRGKRWSDPGQIEFIGREIKHMLVGERSQEYKPEILEQAFTYFTEKNRMKHFR